MGFFNPMDLVSKPSPRMTPACGACGLKNKCLSPLMKVDGKGGRGILIVGEAPGQDEDEQGKPFVGRSGVMLRDYLLRVGIEMRKDCWLTNALICRPPRNKIPKQQMIEWCRPNLAKTLDELKPRVIILLGKAAVRSFIGHVWKEDVGPISRWVGWVIPCREPNAWVIPTWHPSYLLRSGRYGRGDVDPVLEGEMVDHFREALEVSGRPWGPGTERGVVPDMNRAVRRVVHPAEAADYIHRLADGPGPVAFDFETDRLKPDTQGARILCCAVSDGFTTVAYPWVGEAVTASKELLYVSEVPKMGFNIKFEGRWVLKEFGRPVKNWVMDGMQCSHLFDNRRGICSLKFQAFVRLGAESYDDSIKAYMKAKGGNERNRLHEVGLDKLLLYCGTDALLEWQLGRLYMKELEQW